MPILGYRPHKPKVLESDLQERVVKWAREKYKGKLIVIKRQSGKFGTNGWPDYEFLIKKGRTFHIEFKRPGGKCTDLQLQRHAELRALGHTVHLVDNEPLGKAVIDGEMRRAA